MLTGVGVNIAPAFSINRDNSNQIDPTAIMMTSSNGNIFRVIGLCEGNSPVTGEFPSQRPVTQSFDVFFDLRLE